MEFLKKEANLNVPYRGIVVVNDDPREIGRVKCIIQGLMEETDYNKLPWLGRKSSAFPLFYVPEINSELEIQFPFNGDTYSGQYTGCWESDTTHQGIFNEDYPESYGFRDSQNTYFKVNKKKKYMELHHTSGSSLKFLSQGEIELRGKKYIKFISEDGKTEINFDMNTGAINLNPKEGVTTGGSQTFINSKKLKIDVSSKDERIKGSSESNIGGGRKVKIGGGDSLSVVGNRAISTGGDKSELIAGETEITYGSGQKEQVVLGDLVREIIKGNFKVDIVAGNIILKTTLGDLNIGNSMAGIGISKIGSIDMESMMSTNIKASMNATVQASIVATLKGALTKIGPGMFPNVTIGSDPIEDFVTGKIKVGQCSVLS